MTILAKNIKNKIPLVYHFLFWVLYFVLNFIRWGSYFNDYWYSFKSNLVEFPLHIVIVYFNIYFLIPKFIINKKYLAYFFNLIVALTILYIVRTELNYFLVSKNIWPEAIGHQKAFTFNHIVAVTLGEIYVIAFVSVIKLTIDWISVRNRNESLENSQLKTELNFLKSQIQPHFFFNTLNNLYALALEKSDKTPSVILKLAEIMQYVLYDVKDTKIKLLKEINYIYTYLELEKLRYGDLVESKINIKGDLDKIAVPPLLFLPFIENCFKHGSKNNDKVNIEISFYKKMNFLFFSVENNYVKSNNFFTKHGIGIKNIKRRLQLLYGKNYRINILKKDNKYSVNLIIPIK